ncbi:PREDICTED: uncharacterized protein LOC105140737 [Populus euphratica]|uniref:Uncharacterized protein LOC105140737 n=1 Tax=Populus euphratica TaxID=75702 RepID=A0AAJ6Y8B1_POPEU|nr:PREDICTED: uncharacterized protein LOC105140737 [Populus euphratica]
MAVLRSSGILPTVPSNNKGTTSEPVTPSRTREPSTHQSPPTPNPPGVSLLGSDSAPPRRRSLRLASKSLSSADASLQTPTRERKKGSDGKQGRLVSEGDVVEKMTERDVGGEVLRVLSLRSGKKVVDNRNIEIEGEEVKGSSVMRTKGKGKGRGRGNLGKKVLNLDVQEEFVEIFNDNAVERSDNLEEKLSDSSRGKRKCTGEVKMERGEEGGVAVEDLGKSPSADVSGTSTRGRRKYNREVKVGAVKEGVVEGLKENPCTDENGSSRRGRRYGREGKEKRSKEGAVVIEELGEKPVALEGGSSRGRMRYSREEKGKGKLVVDDGLISNGKDMLQLEPRVKNLVDGLAESVVLEERKEGASTRSKVPESRMEKFRDIARQNASRFAHFEVQEHETDHHDVEMPSVEEEQDKVEDWPGPFSTAMKIIRDRANRLNLQQRGSTSEKEKPVPITWMPKTDRACKRSKGSVPSLQELCMKILVKNADAIASLEHVPDTLRHRLCQLLCDSRRMNAHFLALLVRGSPMEIRIRDCSWLAEEEFTNIFEVCDSRNLTVLQLDQCGRCMADYTLLATLARSPGSLPRLTTLSISGACRLSDAALSSLVSSAPALQSLNLSQCSLLTSASIDTLADSLATSLRELYINDCQSIQPMLILPALKKLEHLEVLSLSGIQTINDNFLRGFIVARGHNIKELVLTDCVKLTDSSMKVIAETCSKLCALDLGNLRKLTDSALGFLANACREIHTLKLCRNAFSDEAIAAFLESSGELLKELSLNNVKKVGHCTALSLARRSRKLLSLDLSWCRNLTNEALGLIVDSCLSLKVLKLFGCSQVTNVFLDGHSNSDVQIIGLKTSPVLEHIMVPELQEFALRYSSVSSI